jgi:hypothetical protein
MESSQRLCKLEKSQEYSLCVVSCYSYAALIVFRCTACCVMLCDQVCTTNAASRSITQHHAALRSITQHHAALRSIAQHQAALRTNTRKARHLPSSSPASSHSHASCVLGLPDCVVRCCVSALRCVVHCYYLPSRTVASSPLRQQLHTASNFRKPISSLMKDSFWPRKV